MSEGIGDVRVDHSGPREERLFFFFCCNGFLPLSVCAPAFSAFAALQGGITEESDE